ncbi:hypothetical protein GH714_011327 [Hevea brasiliensis]|uniref:UspA domain-containing protein n=1 Tax=Hevea brasiliensis TaxID=3981 RepID=A0A6A6LXA2_HEVBR|nr:hypothetical protein GH714_011327 [Hevea brasiliensis]
MSVSTTAEIDDFHPHEGTNNTASYHHHRYEYTNSSEIEEENSSELFEINHGGEPMESIKEEVFSLDVESRGEDCVYVAVGKSESSMDALSWTLKNLVNGYSTMVYLIHVFPEIHHIPSPCRHILIESDMVAKAIMDLIPIFNIRKLVLGTTKSSLRKLRARKGSGIVDQILANASEFCEIKIICEGKEVADNQTMITGSPSASPRPTGDANASTLQLQDQPNANNDSFSCMCFKSPRVM